MGLFESRMEEGRDRAWGPHEWHCQGELGCKNDEVGGPKEGPGALLGSRLKLGLGALLQTPFLSPSFFLTETKG